MTPITEVTHEHALDASPKWQRPEERSAATYPGKAPSANLER